MQFELHPNLQKKMFVAKLPLCDVLMEDESAYPWFFLVPRRAGVSRIMDLNSDDQLLLLKELDLLQNVVWNEFKPTQINVAAIGNKTPQLHIHVIARYADDPAWPGTVWDHPVKTPYDPVRKTQIAERISRILLS
jgi:diadenosine tetraphosphate (Ap4A) HIT family hydrolase